MNAVPGFLDKIDTYPGLSSDLAAKESSMEDFHVRWLKLPYTCSRHCNLSRRAAVKVLVAAFEPLHAQLATLNPKNKSDV